jgi:murein hydrolase activator
VTDLSRAVPAGKISTLPSTAAQYQSLKKNMAAQQPAVASARQNSEALARETLNLQYKLVATAAQVSALEDQKIHLDDEITRLTAENSQLTNGFLRDRAGIVRLLAVLERLQHDMPPAMVLKPGDVLAAARGSMLVGAGLPEIYRAAAALAGRIDRQRQVRQSLIARRSEAERNAVHLAEMHGVLDRLLTQKRIAAEAAAGQYADLRKKLDLTASQAENLQMLLNKVAALRTTPAAEGIVIVRAKSRPPMMAPERGSLLRPVAGDPQPGGIDGVGGAQAPGLTYVASGGAQVVAPSDADVRFAGPYQKSGQVLILEIGGGYHAVLTGLGRLDVRLGDHVLAGEPVGRMPQTGQTRLYFELRHNGQGINPAPYVSAGSRKARK